MLHCLDNLHSFGLDPVTSAIWPASIDPKIINLPYQITVYAASVHTNLDCL